MVLSIRDIRVISKTQRLLRKQFYQEKTAAEAEISRLRKALNAKSAAAAAVIGPEKEAAFTPGIDASAGAVSSGSAASDLGLAFGEGNKDKAADVSAADALNASMTLSPHTSPVTPSSITGVVSSVDEKSSVKSGGGSGGSLAPAGTVRQQQQHTRQHTVPTSTAVIRELWDYETLRTPASAFLLLGYYK